MSKFGDELEKAANTYATLSAVEENATKKSHFQALAEIFSSLASQWPADAAGQLTNNGTGTLSWTP